jgi:hypothetical protein
MPQRLHESNVFANLVGLVPAAHKVNKQFNDHATFFKTKLSEHFSKQITQPISYF